MARWDRGGGGSSTLQRKTDTKAKLLYPSFPCSFGTTQGNRQKKNPKICPHCRTLEIFGKRGTPSESKEYPEKKNTGKSKKVGKVGDLWRGAGWGCDFWWRCPRRNLRREAISHRIEAPGSVLRSSHLRPLPNTTPLGASLVIIWVLANRGASLPTASLSLEASSFRLK